MAKYENTTIAHGVTRTDWPWGYCLEGSKSALLNSGLAQAPWFPNGRRDKRGRTIRNLCSEHDGRSIRCTEPPKGDCRVHIEYSHEEQTRARQREQFEKAVAETKRKLEQLPNDAQGYLEERARWVEAFVRSFVSIGGRSKYDGYRLHPDTISEIQRIGGHLVAAVETGKTIFIPADRTAAEIEIRAELAKSDPALQRFMVSIQAPAAT